jgi:predicted GNAT family acetyltransferase
MQLEDGRFKVSSLTPADAMSLLYLLTAGTVDFSSGASYGDRIVGNHFIISSDELAINEFSDRPYRFAQAYGGDANDFAAFYQGSNFETDNPNATIVGTNPGTGDIFYSIFEIGDLFSYDDKVIVTIRSLLGSSELPDSSFLTNASIVIDNFFTDLGKAIVSGTCIGTVESILTVEGFDAMLAESALTGCDAAGETFIAMCSAAMAESVVGVGACAAGGGTFIKLCNDSDVPYYEKKEKMAESMCP